MYTEWSTSCCTAVGNGKFFLCQESLKDRLARLYLPKVVSGWTGLGADLRRLTENFF